MEIIKSTTENRIDIAKAALAKKSLKDLANGESYVLKEIIIGVNTKDGEDQEVSCVKLEKDGACFWATSISPIVRNDCENLIYMLEELKETGEEVTVTPTIFKSKGQRDCLALDM